MSAAVSDGDHAAPVGQNHGGHAGDDGSRDDYRLRFQIEFNFRDAKQYWGLDDFMNTSPTAVTNAANLALFMVTSRLAALGRIHASQPTFTSP